MSNYSASNDDRYQRRRRTGGGSFYGLKLRLLITGMILLLSVVNYYATSHPQHRREFNQETIDDKFPQEIPGGRQS